MLIQFNFKNHKSFYEKSCIDMTTTTEKRHLENTIELNGNRLLPFLSIYGANASGKSTVIDAFYFMARAIVITFDSNINDDFMVVPFAFSTKAKQEPSEFEVFINIDDYEYRYGFIASRDNVIEEWLYKKLFKKNTRAKEKMVFERLNNKVKFSNEFVDYSQYESLINAKSLLLSFLGRKGFPIFIDIYNWFLNIVYIQDVPKRVWLEPSIRLLHQDKELYKKFICILNEIDPCLKELEILEKEDENQRRSYEVYGKHTSIDDKDNLLALPIEGESTGTRKIIKILPVIIKSLTEGTLLFIDELDTQLHPLLFKKIVSMYNDKQINRKKAQLVFTAHNTYILNGNDARRDQIMFVEKDKNGMSKLCSLSDFKKMRVDADYEKKYFAGSFGSIPFQDR